MQLTNICRDVDEDWRRGRLYLPMGLLEKSGMKWLSGPPSYPTFPHHAIAPRAVVATLLAEADRYYRSSERGLQALDWRCALAVRTARRIYAAIGNRIAARGYDVLSGRVVVSRKRKLLLLVSAICESLFAFAGTSSPSIRASALGVRVAATVPGHRTPGSRVSILNSFLRAGRFR